MSRPYANFEIVNNSAPRFSNATDGDLVFYTGSNSQHIHLGVEVNSNSALKISKGEVDVTGTLSTCNLQVNSSMSVSTDILPTETRVFNLGSSNMRFKDLFLSGNSIDLDGAIISKAADGSISIPSIAVGSNLNVAFVSASNLTGSNVYTINATASNTYGNQATFTSSVTTSNVYSSNVSAPNAAITTLTTSNVFSSNVTVPTALTANQVNASNVSVTTALTAPQITASTSLTTSNVFSSNVTVPTALTANQVNASNITVSSVTTTGNVAIGGNLTVSGSTTTVDTQTLLVKDNLITLNSNLTSNAPSFLTSGIEVNRGGGLSNYLFVFEESSRFFKIGMSNNLQAVMTRNDAMTSGYTYYDSTSNKAINKTIDAADIGTGVLTVPQGGTGANTLAANKLLIGAGTSAVSGVTNLHYDATNTRLGVSNVAPQYTLDVSGVARVSSNIITDSQFWAKSNDTVSAPGHSWSNDGDTGMFHPANDTIGFSTNGVERVKIDNDGLKVGLSNVGLGTITLSNGLVDGVDVSVLNKRVRTSRATATNAVSKWTSRASASDTINWATVCWSPELSLFVAVAGGGTGNRVMTSPDGITWTSRASANNTMGWNSVCWSPELSLFVAVAPTGTGNRVMTSSDGITWTSRASADDTMGWHSVCWSSELSLFVAVAFNGTGNRVMTSPDGITWTSRASTDDTMSWRSVCWSPELSLFVAVANSGTGNRVMTSPDGITWTSRASSSNTMGWYFVCWSPELSLFVAVAYTGTGNRVMTSPDGITWTSRASANDNFGWISVCWSPELSLFVAVAYAGTGNRVMTSSDGIMWTSRASANDSLAWTSVCWSSELSSFVAVASSGTGNRVMTSEIGIPASKNALMANPAYAQFNNSNGQLLMNSNDSASNPSYTWLNDSNTGMFHPANDTIGFSTNGVERARIDSNIKVSTHILPTADVTYDLGSSNMRFRDLYLSGNTIYMGTGSNTTSISVDSNSGGIVMGSNTQMPSITVGSNGVFVTLSNGQVWASSNDTSNIPGYTWSNDVTTGIYHPTQGAIAFAGQGTERLRIDPTGRIGVGLSNPQATLDVNGFMLVGVSNVGLGTITLSNGLVDGVDVSVLNKRVRTSRATATNAVSKWTSRASANDSMNWTSVCWSPELSLFVALASGGTGNRVMTSPDGITWTSRASYSMGWRSVCWSPELSLFVAVGASIVGNRVMTSPDGITWTWRASANDSMAWRFVCWSPELSLFLAVAESGTGNRVMTSPDGITWTSRASANDSMAWSHVCWSPELSLFVAVAGSGTGNRVMTSPDGITWTSRATPTNSMNWVSVCWSPELSLFAAVAYGGTGNRVMTSPDGITWTSRVSANDDSMAWYSICWSSELSLFVAVAYSGTGNRVMTSPDGITWTSRASANDSFAWQSVCWSPELSLFVAVASGGTGNRVMTSEIGIPASKNALMANPAYAQFNNSNGQLLLNSNDSASNPTYSFLNDSNTGMFHAADDTIGFSANGSERMRITPSNIGVATNNPQFALDVNGVTRVSSNVITDAQFWAKSNDTSSTPGFSWSNDSNTGLYHPVQGAIGFVTNGAERARFNSTGNFGIGQNNPAYRLDVTGAIHATSNIYSEAQYFGQSTDSSNAPAFTWCNDSNTGLYHPSNATIGFVTNGVERARFTGSNLGINTSNPAYTLDVKGTINASNILINGEPVSAGLALNTSNFAACNITCSNLYSDTSAATKVLTVSIDPINTGVIATSNQKVLFNQNIGIGDVTNLQTSLDAKFDKAGGTLTGDTFTQCNIFVARQVFANSNDYVSAPGYSWSNDPNTGFYHLSNDRIGVVTNGVERMHFNSNGFIGVNTSAPQYPMHMVNAGGIRHLTLQSTQANQANEIYFDSTLNNAASQTAALGMSGDTARNFYLWVNGADRINVNNAGNVGINTNSPATTLDVNGSARATNLWATSQVFTKSNDTVANPGYSWSNDSNTGLYHPANSKIGIVTNGVERVRVESNGFIGIGKTNPQFAIDFASSNSVNAILSIQNTTPMSAANTYPMIRLADNYKDRILGYAVIREGIYLENGGGGDTPRVDFNLVTGTDGVERTALCLQGNLGSPGYVGIGTTAPSYPLHIATARAGISFSGGGYYFNTNTVLTSFSTNNFNTSVWAAGHYVGVGFVANSDRRIKKDFNSLDTQAALNSLRQLTPTQYKFIDENQNTNRLFTGFVAQEVKEIISNAVSVQKQVIPNIFAVGYIEDHKITLETSVEGNRNQTTTRDFDFDSLKTTDEQGNEVVKPLVVKVIHDETGQEEYVEVDEIIDDHTFTLKSPIASPTGRIFVYGQEVYDFHVLDKDTVFTVALAALKEVDGIVQKQSETIKDLQAQLAALSARLEAAGI